MSGYSDTPIVSDAFSRFMLDNIDDTEVARNNTPEFFQSFYGINNGGKTTYVDNGEVFEFEVQRAGYQTLAPMIPRGINATMGSVQDRNAESRRTLFARTFPLAEEKASITQDMLLKRLPGEQMYEAQLGRNLTNFDRARYWSSRKLDEQVARMKRLYEYLAAQVTLFGTMPAVLNTTTEIYDYRRLATHSSDESALALWSVAGTNILGRIDAGIVLSRDDSYLKDPYYMLICGVSVAPHIFGTNTAIKALLENRRAGDMSVKLNAESSDYPREVTEAVRMGLRPLGYFTTPMGFKVYVMVCDQFYHVGSTKTYYFPATSALLYPPSMRGDRAFGPHERGVRLPQDMAEMQALFGFASNAPQTTSLDTSSVFPKDSLYFDFYRSEDKRTINLVTQAAPVFIPYNVNAPMYYYSCV